MADFILAVHGGAGTLAPEASNPSLERESHAGLRAALGAGYRVLTAGGAAEEAVVTAVMVLEDDPQFNAGRGSMFNAAGHQEMEAAVMEGRSRVTGAVAGICGPRNPVLAAMAVLKRSPNGLLVGAGALAFLQGHIPFEDEAFFQTERRWRALQAKLARQRSGGLAPLDDADRYGAVGAVALDRSGGMAAATSTGGTTGNLPGRAGDASVIGAGTWASEHCAISATGDGDTFSRAAVAYEIVARMRFNGQALAAAANDVMTLVGQRGGSGGLIAVNIAGEVTMPFNARGMYRGVIDAAGQAQTTIYRNHPTVRDLAA